MMKICPKCRSFYDDANLFFCLKDGIPLVSVNQSNELWSQGTKAVEKSRQIIQRKIRLEKLARFSKVIVTTLITILVISVIVMNIYIYSSPKSEEIAKNISPSPQITNSPNASPLPQTSVLKKTSTPKVTETPICSENEIKSKIIKEYFETWKNELDEQKSKYQKIFADEHKIQIEFANARLLFDEKSISIVKNPDCKVANVKFTYTYEVSAIGDYANKIKKKPYQPTENNPRVCKKSDEKWNCK